MFPARCVRLPLEFAVAELVEKLNRRYERMLSDPLQVPASVCFYISAAIRIVTQFSDNRLFDQ